MAYLRLIRFFGVFTALADVLAGFFILRFAGFSRDLIGYLPHLLVASGCFYFAGMAWNDLFDIETDKKLRPDRPLSANEISLTRGYVLAITFSAVGLMLAMTASAAAFLVAAILLTLILIYNGGGKKIELLSPIIMGGCRAMNLLLGMSAQSDFENLLSEPLIYLPIILLFSYVAIITLLSEWEDPQNDEPILPIISDPTTDIGNDLLMPAPPADPKIGRQQSELRLARTMQIVFKQNRLSNNNNQTAPKNIYRPPILGMRGGICGLLLTILFIALLLPYWYALIFCGLLILSLLPAAIKVWRVNEIVNLRNFIGSALAGICLFDAALTAGFCRDFWYHREAIGACVVIALLNIPAIILRKYMV